MTYLPSATMLLSSDEVLFLWHSNMIEQECRLFALVDALKTWAWVKERVVHGRNVSVDDVLCVHSQLLQYWDPDIAGVIRDEPVMIGGVTLSQSRDELEKDLERLCNFIPTTHKEIKQWHVWFEKIHPFADGNGRTGRILMNWQCLRAGLPLIVITTGVEQQKYYGWFR